MPNWVVSWAGAVQGPYPIGNANAQPELGFALADPERGASDQTFRLIVRPDIWGKEARIRLSNAFGTRPVTFDDVHAGLQLSGGVVLPSSNRAITFDRNASVTVLPGQWVESDPVALPFVRDPDDPLLAGRKLAISFHVANNSGPMTWHAKGLQTSYISAPNRGSHAADETEAAFPFSTTSWYFLDAVIMAATPGTQAIVAIGDSITDGTCATLNGDDRWPDTFSRRLHAAHGNRFAVVNQGIGGNQVVGPSRYDPADPVPGGPSALSRLDRDIVSLPGVGAVIWLEGINDFGISGATVEAVAAGFRQGVGHLRAKLPGVKIFVGTLTPSLHSSPSHGTPQVEAKRQALNCFFRTEAIFDGVADFEAVTLDPITGGLLPAFAPNSTIGGPGDRLHPNRAGYVAMGGALNLGWFAPALGD
jgi:lysophospholipase L1-like esterase